MALGALMMMISGCAPNRASQVRVLRSACSLYRTLRLDRPGDRKRVTCAELVVRAYVESGLPVHIHPNGGQRFDLDSMYGGMRELGEEAIREWRRPRRARRMRGSRGPAKVNAVSSHLRIDPEGSSRILAEGKPWVANLMAPHYLETSPDFEFMGRLHCEQELAIEEHSRPRPQTPSSARIAA
jgi:hypothetical protein